MAEPAPATRGRILADGAVVPPRPAGDERPLETMVAERVGVLLDRLGGRGVPRLFRLVMDEVERGVFRAALQRTGGRVGAAADLLGVDRNSVARKAKRLGLTVRGRGRPRRRPA